MAFWENFDKLCKSNGTTPGAVARALGFSNATATKWKSGSVPTGKSLKKIAEHFDVTVDLLLDRDAAETAGNGEFTEQELMLIRAYRSHPEMQSAVEKLLGVQGEGNYVRIYTAAKSDDRHPDKVINLSKDQWERIKNSPETDDSLL
jgi:transcriptional regulator with XRE-family HTH domain